MKNVKIALLVCLLIMAAANPIWADWSGAAADQPISWSSNYRSAQCSRVIYEPVHGNLVAVWIQDTSSINIEEIAYSISSDGGYTWSGTSADSLLSADNSQRVRTVGDKPIAVASDRLGNIYVVWSEVYTDSVEIMMSKSTDGGHTWSGTTGNFPVSDTTSIKPAYDPEIAVDTSDNIYVVWQQKTALVDTSEIFISISTDYGINWSGRSADRKISYADGSYGQYPAIAVAPNNDIYVVWSEKADPSNYNSNEILYGKSTDGGASFSSESADNPISTQLRNSTCTQIVIDYSGNIHVTWRATRATAPSYYYEVLYSGSTDGGVSWSGSAAPIVVDPGVLDGKSVNCPSIGVSSTGVLTCIWHETPSGYTDAEIWASISIDCGTTWSGTVAPELVSFPDGRGAYKPDIFFGVGDTMHVVWQEQISFNYSDIHYSRRDPIYDITTGTILGTITELDGVTTIEGVAVTAFDSMAVAVGYDTTDTNGEYFLLHLNPGDYSLAFSIFTHHDTSVTGIVVEANVIDTVDISLTPSTQGTISGTVYDATGTNPVNSVIVEVTDQYATLMGTDTTDGAGNYGLTLYPGTLDLSFDDTLDLFSDTTVQDQVLAEAGAVDLDVNMTWAIPADDIGPVSIDVPLDYMVTGRSYNPAVTVENFGYQDQTFDLNLVIDDGSRTIVYNETLSSLSIDSLNSDQFAFPTSFTPITAGDYDFTATTINTGDENSENDVLDSVIVTAYLHQGSGGPDNYGYEFRDNTVPDGPTYNWIDVSLTGTQISPATSFFQSGPFPIGFSFPFYGVSYDSIWVSSGGELHIGYPDSWTNTNDCPLPDMTYPNAPQVAVFWDFLDIRYYVHDDHGVYYQYFDDPTNDYTVVQWKVEHYQDYPNYETLEFEVILYENGDLLYQYKQVGLTSENGVGQQATIGLEDDAIPSGISYLCNDDNIGNRLTDGLAIFWSTNFPVSGSISGTVTDGSRVPVPDVYVSIVGTGMSDSTDVSGAYSFPTVFPTTHSISFSHPDYADTVVTDIVVQSGLPYVLDVVLQTAGYAYLPADMGMYYPVWPPAVQGGDVTYYVNFMRQYVTSIPCYFDGPLGNFWASADVNGSCGVDGADLSTLVSVMRNILDPMYCDQYPTAWPTPLDLPETEPSGWPNCDNSPPVTTDIKVVPAESGK